MEIDILYRKYSYRAISHERYSDFLGQPSAKHVVVRPRSTSKMHCVRPRIDCKLHCSAVVFRPRVDSETHCSIRLKRSNAC